MVRIKRVTDGGTAVAAQSNYLPPRQPRRHSCSLPSPTHRILAPHGHAFHSTDANGTAKPTTCRRRRITVECGRW